MYFFRQMHTLKKSKPDLQQGLCYFYSCLQLLTPKAQPAHLRPVPLLGGLQAADEENTAVGTPHTRAHSHSHTISDLNVNISYHLAVEAQRLCFGEDIGLGFLHHTNKTKEDTSFLFPGPFPH